MNVIFLFQPSPLNDAADIFQWEDVGYAQKHKETWEASGNIRPILLDTFPAESEEDVT